MNILKIALPACSVAIFASCTNGSVFPNNEPKKSWEQYANAHKKQETIWQDLFRKCALQEQELIKNGYMVALHFLLERRDIPDWIKNRKRSYMSSFEEIGNMISEITIHLAYKKCESSDHFFDPSFIYPFNSLPKNALRTQGNLTYVFIKRCIFNYLSDDGNEWREDDIERILNKILPSNSMAISRAKSSSLIYLNGLKIADVLDRIKKTLDGVNQDTVIEAVYSGLYNLYPFEIFPSPNRWDKLPQEARRWWVPAPHHGPQSKPPFFEPPGPPPEHHGMPPGPRHGPLLGEPRFGNPARVLIHEEYCSLDFPMQFSQCPFRYWFETWMPEYPSTSMNITK